MIGQPSAVPGYDVPLHRSLTEPVLIAGAPRNFVIPNGTLAAAVGLGLRLWIADYLPWACLVAPGTWLCLDRSR